MIKKIFILLTITLCITFGIKNISIAQGNFASSIIPCDTYKLDGAILHEGITFNLSISLEKQKDKCVYKEKIYQDKKYQLLTCKFDKTQREFIANSMNNYSKVFQNEIAKNNIFSAKLTSNGEVFNSILVNPANCQITYSKTKN